MNYQQAGFSSRDEYLDSLEESVDSDDAWKIRIAADLLGPEEDFDGLLSVLRDEGLDL